MDTPACLSAHWICHSAVGLDGDLGEKICVTLLDDEGGEGEGDWELEISTRSLELQMEEAISKRTASLGERKFAKTLTTFCISAIPTQAIN